MPLELDHKVAVRAGNVTGADFATDGGVIKTL